MSFSLRVVGLALLVVSGLVRKPAQASVVVVKNKVDYEVFRDGSGYLETAELHGFSKESGQYHLFHSLFEELERIDVYFKLPSGKWKKQPKEQVSQQDAITSNYYSGIRQIDILLPRETVFKITYTMRSSELMLLCNLPFQPRRGKQIEYTIALPDPFVLDTQHVGSFPLQVEEVKMNGGRSIRYVCKYSGSQPANKKAFLYCLVRPASEDPWRYFQNWMNGIITYGEDNVTPGSLSVPANLEPEEASAQLLALIQKEISYIDIEDGIRAWKPNSPSVTWSKKKGDCKDMAFFIQQNLAERGISAQLGIVATWGHAVDMKFPCVGAANHMVCVWKDGDAYHVLDATDKYTSFGVPSRHVQGRSVFLLEEGKRIQASVPAPEENRVEHDVSFHNQSGQGTWCTRFYGYSGAFIRELCSSSPNDPERSLLPYFQFLFPSLQSMDDLQLAGLNEDSVQVEFEFTASSLGVHRINERHFLSIKHLPKAHPFTPSVKNEKVFYQTWLNEVHMVIDLGQPVGVAAYEHGAYAEGGFTYSLQVGSSGGKVQVQSVARSDWPDVNAQNRGAYNAFNEAISKSLLKPIQLKNP